MPLLLRFVLVACCVAITVVALAGFASARGAVAGAARVRHCARCDLGPLRDAAVGRLHGAPERGGRGVPRRVPRRPQHPHPAVPDPVRALRPARGPGRIVAWSSSSAMCSPRSTTISPGASTRRRSWPPAARGRTTIQTTSAWWSSARPRACPSARRTSRGRWPRASPSKVSTPPGPAIPQRNGPGSPQQTTAPKDAYYNLFAQVMGFGGDAHGGGMGMS